MKFNIEVNEAQILKKVMAGMNEDDIAKEIIQSAKQTVKNNLHSKIREFVETMSDERFNSSREKLVKELNKELVNSLNKKQLKKILNSYHFDELAAEAIYDYLLAWLDDGQIGFSMKLKGKEFYLTNNKKK